MKCWNDTLILKEKGNFVEKRLLLSLNVVEDSILNHSRGGKKKVFKVGTLIYNISEKSFEVNF